MAGVSGYCECEGERKVALVRDNPDDGADDNWDDVDDGNDDGVHDNTLRLCSAFSNKFVYSSDGMLYKDHRNIHLRGEV